MSDTRDAVLEWALERQQRLNDEIMRRQGQLDEINALLATLRDGRSKLRRDTKRGNSEAPHSQVNPFAPRQPELPEPGEQQP